ncbi:Aste57867_1318 [Aphanomyces stellatus]|uniref:Aste57867_1318 protein n=1 Tax=Aphanomyces stellatus TaxID=120398 RepID=A0A485K664_9STRA|nr:hypothetical protein As57867_001317 [Aphanomyces stellatus]VFT78537.1 Aste57867_1318 [Aphanomyces stellatus]
MTIDEVSTAKGYHPNTVRTWTNDEVKLEAQVEDGHAHDVRVVTTKYKASAKKQSPFKGIARGPRCPPAELNRLRDCFAQASARSLTKMDVMAQCCGLHGYTSKSVEAKH